MSDSTKAALRSFLTTFLSVLLALVPVAAVVEGDFTWVTAALVSAATAALRTVLAALDPGMALYGVGAQDPPA
jgi:heme/copper-type cytochrome/quinol oxidase subunit 4